MPKRSFKKQWLLDNVLDDEGEGVENLEEIVGPKHRWYEEMTTIFSFEGKFYAVKWNRGLTEEQENEYLEHEPEDVELPEMAQVEVTVLKWKPVP